MGFTKYVIAKTDKFVGNGIIGRNALQKRKLEAGLTNDCSVQPAFTCSKITIKTPERRHWSHSSVFVDGVEQILQISGVSIIDSEQANAGWVSGKKEGKAWVTITWICSEILDTS